MPQLFASDDELANPRTAFPARLRQIWDQHLPTEEEPLAEPPRSSLGTLVLRSTTGDAVAERTIKVGRYEVEIGVAAPSSSLLRLEHRYQVRTADLVDFRDTPKAVPQEIPCRTPRYRRMRSVDSQHAPMEYDDLPEPLMRNFLKVMDKYRAGGLSPAITLTWARQRVQVATVLYESRKLYGGSIPKPSDQRRAFRAFHNALHRVMNGIQSDALAPSLESASVENEALHNAHMAIAQMVLEHLLGVSDKVRRKLETTHASPGAPKQVERADLLAAIAARLGKARKIPIAQRTTDAAKIASILGVQKAFNAIDEKLLDSGPPPDDLPHTGDQID